MVDFSNRSIDTVQPLAEGSLWAKSRDWRCPPDKSVTHRTVLFASLAKGRSVIDRPLLGEDCVSTIVAMRRLGVSIDIETGGDHDQVIVDSNGFSAWKSPDAVLDCGNSGTTCRLMLGLLASCNGLKATLTGDESLSKRPMGRVVEPLVEMGADIRYLKTQGCLPIEIHGKRLEARSLRVSKASAQVKSAILLAGLATEGKTSVVLPVGSRTHTEIMLQRMGVTLHADRDETMETVTVAGPATLPSTNWRVPGDPSSAAFLLVLAGIHGGPSFPNPCTIEAVLNNATRTGCLEVIERMGVSLERRIDNAEDWVEPVMDLVFQSPTHLNAVEIKAKDVPRMVDEIPILAVAACFAAGRSHFHGLDELRVKESDRLAKTLELILAAGGVAKIDGDDLIIDGRADFRPKVFSYDPEGDHRMAMSAAILATKAAQPCSVVGTDCIQVSFPGFFDLLKELG